MIKNNKEVVLKDKPISITIRVADYTPTELMTEIQRMRFQDPEINELMIAMFRKVADALENKKIGVTGLTTEVKQGYSNLPSCKFSFEFYDQEQANKHSGAVKEQS